MQHETFYGIKYLLDKNDIDTTNRPVLFIIPNIKSFPPNVLNDMIHMMKVYRSQPHFLNLNLMLGVEANNKEELHLRVSIQNCVKLVIKTFHTPSMKNIILEVIYKLLQSQDNLLSYDPVIIQHII